MSFPCGVSVILSPRRIREWAQGEDAPAPVEKGVESVGAATGGVPPPTRHGGSWPGRPPLRRVLQGLQEEGLELRADLLRPALELVQELALLVFELVVVEDHLPQPRRFLSIDSSVRQ